MAKQSASRRPRPEPLDQDVVLAALARAIDGAQVRVPFIHFRQVHRHLEGNGGKPGPSEQLVTAGLTRALRAGLVEKEEGRCCYRPTPSGRRRLAYLRKRDRYPVLPINPYWLDWRVRRRDAKKHLPALRRQLAQMSHLLSVASLVLEPEEVPISPGWLFGSDVDDALEELRDCLKWMCMPEPAKR